MEDGLNHNHVEALHVDSSNRVWIGTEGGINTFDGDNWTSFTTEDGLPENFIREIDMDSLYRIWVGTNESGYAMYNDTVWTVYDTINDIPFLHGWALECDYEGNIWIGETGALGTFDGSQWTTLTSTDGMTNSFVRSIKAAEDGAIWIGTSSGATRYKEGLFTPYIPDGLSADRVYAFVEGAAQEYWFGTTRSLSFYDGTHWENYRSSDGLPCSNVLSMIKDHAGNLWLGTGCGVGKYDGDQFTQFTSEIGLSKLRIRAVFEDADNNIWVGSEGGGVAKYDGLDWSTFTTDNGLPDNNVYSICQDTADNIWVGTFGGVCYFDGSDWTSYTTSDGLPDNDITSVRSGPDGTLWIGTFGGGICTWDDGFFAQTTFENANSNYVWCISFVNDNELWVGTYGGIEIFDGDSWTNQSFPGTSNGIHCIDEDEAGNIWVCMKDNGVFRYGGAITKVREVHSSPIEVEVFPNPANETISIHIKSIFKPHFTARVFSLDGKLVASYGLLSKQSEIDISKLSSGMYLLYVTDDGGRFITSRKFFKY